MTLVVIAGGIDLSVGSVLAFSASLAGLLLVRWTPHIPAGAQIAATVAAVLALGAVIGAVNGGRHHPPAAAAIHHYPRGDDRCARAGALDDPE